MKQLNINLIVLALGIAFSTGAIAQNQSTAGATPTWGSLAVESWLHRTPLQLADAGPAIGVQSVESIESAEAAALLAAARKKALSVRLDALYEVAKEQCNTYAVDARPHCLIQMKAGFGK